MTAPGMAAASGPRHVAILGLGPSLEAYVDIAKRLGGRRAFCDETWGINALGDVIACDRIFHMDDVRVQALRADRVPESNIAEMLKWLRRHPGPIYTSRLHPDYPGLVEYPIEAVLNSLGFSYFNSTAAWAIAYAIHLRVERISLFGIDFTYKNAHDAERGRACCEFWLGLAAARGIVLNIATSSSLMDMCEPAAHRLYGYDGVNVEVAQGEDGRLAVSMTERPLPAAEEIERRYDHSKHPNSLVVTS